MKEQASEVIRRCDGLEGAVLAEGAFGPGPAVWVGKREVAHVDDAATIDVRLTKAVIRARRADLKGDERVSLRASGSDWIQVRVRSVDDADFAAALIGDAVAANASAPAGLPPRGSELERRRRFH